MVEAATRKRLFGMALFILAALVTLFVRLLPVEPGAIRWPGPDLTLCLIAAWVLRRPEQLPALLVVIVALVEDLVLMRPIGLWTLVVLILSEMLRQRVNRWHDQAFLFEWFRVSLLFFAAFMGYRVLTILMMLPVPPLGLVMLRIIATIAAYPVVVLAARWFLGLRRPTQAELEVIAT